jgi:hypothetical protein
MRVDSGIQGLDSGENQEWQAEDRNLAENLEELLANCRDGIGPAAGSFDQP